MLGRPQVEAPWHNCSRSAQKVRVFQYRVGKWTKYRVAGRARSGLGWVGVLKYMIRYFRVFFTLGSRWGSGTCWALRSRQRQKLKWIRLVEPLFFRIFATTLQHICNNTSLFLQLHFVLLQHVLPTLSSTELLWSGKCHVINTGHSLRKCPFFVTNTFRHSRGDPSDLLDV